MFSENLTEILVVKMLLADLSHSSWTNKMYSPVIYKKYQVLYILHWNKKKICRSTSKDPKIKRLIIGKYIILWFNFILGLHHICLRLIILSKDKAKIKNLNQEKN